MGPMQDLQRLALELPVKCSTETQEAYTRLCAFIEAHQPWLPPQQEGFGPWVEYKPGDKGPCVNDIVMVVDSADRSQKHFDAAAISAQAVDWEQYTGGFAVAAYCVKESK